MRTRAVIIKKQNTNEHDQLVTCYTQELGKLTAVAKSVLKHNSLQAMQLDALNLVEFELVSGRSASWRMPIIAAAQAERSFPGIKGSLQKLGAAFFFLEVMDRMVFDNEKDERLWAFLTGFLEEAEHAPTERLLALFRSKQLELMHVLGYSPQVAACVRCGTGGVEAGWALSVQSGGLLCRNCFSPDRNGVVLARSDVAFLAGGQASLAMTASPFRSIIDALFEHVAGFRFASLDFFYGLSPTLTRQRS